MSKRRYAIQDLPYRDELIAKLRIWSSRKIRAWILSRHGDTFCRRTLQKWAKKVKEGFDFASADGVVRKKRSPFGNLYLNKMLFLIERKEKEIEKLKLGSLPRERAEKTLWGFLKDLESIEASRNEEPVHIPKIAEKEDGGTVLPKEDVSAEEWADIEKEIEEENDPPMGEEMQEVRGAEKDRGVRNEQSEEGRPELVSPDVQSGYGGEVQEGALSDGEAATPGEVPVDREGEQEALDEGALGGSGEKEALGGNGYSEGRPPETPDRSASAVRAD